MMMQQRTKTLLTLAAALAAFSTNALAAPVVIPNFSFEGPVTGGATTSMDSWTNVGSGVFVSPGFGQGAAPTDGNQIAFLNVDNGDIFQTLGTNFAAGTDYTLSVDVSSRAGPGTDSITLGLYHSTTDSIVKSRNLDGTDGVVADAFNTFTLDVTAADILAAGGVGNPIGIHIFGNNNGAGTSDFDLDNVRLDANAAVPEPGSLLLAALGLLGLMGIRRRRNR